MKLYLSSYQIPTPEILFELVGKKPQDISMGLITNSKDEKSRDEFQQKLDESLAFFALIKLKPTLVDLRKFKNPDQTYKALKTFDLIWGWGGNTFILRYEMKRSGFDEVIRKLLDKGAVYGGESAGAIVAGTSLRGIDFADDPTQAKEVVWEGLSLVDKAFIPHVDSPDTEFTERLPKFLELYADDPDTLISLKDNEAFVVDGKKTKIVSSPYKPGTHDVDYVPAK